MEILEDLILWDFEILAQKEKLNSLERVKKIYISQEKFTVENGLLTPTLKIKWYIAKEFFKPQILQMYEGVE